MQPFRDDTDEDKIGAGIGLAADISYGEVQFGGRAFKLEREEKMWEGNEDAEKRKRVPEGKNLRPDLQSAPVPVETRRSVPPRRRNTHNWKEEGAIATIRCDPRWIG